MTEILFKFTEKINAIQQYLDEKNVDIPYKRYFIAYLGGVIRKPIYNKIRRQALNEGADELTIEALDRFAERDNVAKNLWKAYCYINYYNKAIAEAIIRFNVPEDQLKTMIEANALGLFFEWASWPKEI